MTAPRTATTLVLRGHGSHLVFRRGDDETSLEFHDWRHQLVFVGDDVSLQETALGTLATVALESVPDRDTTTLTLVVPTVQLPDDSDHLPVSTDAVFTVTRTSIAGPALVVGQVQCYSVLPMHGTAYAASPAADSGTWEAGYVSQPDNSLRSTVRGRLSMPTPGFDVTLKRHVPQGINPTDLLLDLVIIAPTGIEPQHVVDVDVQYEEPSDGHFKTVTILPSGPTVEIRPAR